MSERPVDSGERTGPIEPVDATHVEQVESHTDPVTGSHTEHRETTTTPASASHVERIEYASGSGWSGAAAEERQQRGILYGVIAGVAAVLLIAILWFAFLSPARSGSGSGQTNVNVAGGQNAQQAPPSDLQLNVNLTQQ